MATIPKTEIEFTFEGPKKGADRAVLLAHGAGSDLNAPALVAVVSRLVGAGIPTMRFNFAYRAAGRRAPDRPHVLEATARAAALELSRICGLAPSRLVLGGRSMGGRICSQIVGSQDSPVDALGLLLLGYPLYPSGHPEKPRSGHFENIGVPSLFVSGTRDALAGQADLQSAANNLRAAHTLHWLDSADHAFKPLKASGRTTDEVIAEVADISVQWVLELPIAS